MARILLSKPMKSSMWMCMLAILFLLCACAPPCHAVKYLEAVITGSTNADIPLIQAGWKAAAKKLGVESAMSSFTMGATLGQSIAAAVTSSQALAVFGLYDDEATSLVMQSTEFTNAKLVLFGPYTESMGIRVWSDNVYFMSADPMTELISLLNWALSKPVSLGNVGWMFLTGNLFDDSLEGKLTDQLLFLGLGAPVVYNELAANGYNAAKFSALMAQTPTCMFVFGARGTHTTTFFQNLIMNAYVKNAANKFYVMLPFSLMHTTSEAFQKLYIVDATKVMPMANIRYSSPLPSPSSTAFSAGATFTAAMTAFNSGYTSATLTTTSGFLAFYGWLFMQQINYIGNTYNLGGGLNYADLKTNTFTQNRYIFGDLVLGNYGGKCPNEATATLLGAACSCNQGGHIVTIVKMTNIVTQNLPINSGVTLDSDGFYIYPNTPCRGSNLNVSGRISNLVGGVVTVASSATSTMSAQVLAALTASSDTSLFGLKSPLTFTASSIDTTAANMVATLKTKFTVNMLRVLLGPMAAPFQPETMSDFLIVDPITIPPPLERAYAPNVMYLSSSLRQEFYTAASYLGSSAMLALKPDVHIRVRCENDEFVVNAISGSLGYFNVPLTSAIGVGWTVSFVNEIPTSGYTFVVGLTASDISPLKAFLIANKNANVIMWFDEFTALYDTISSVFTLTESPFMSQLLFSTNIPSWTQSGSATNAQKFVSKLSNANKSPVAMRAFLGAMVVDQLTLGSSNISAAALRQQMGDRALFAVDDVPLGPYFDGSSADAQTFGSANTKCPILPKLAVDECSSYTGARDVSLWSYKRVATPATALLHNPGYQPMFYASVQYATKAPPTVSTTTATPATTITTTVTTTTVMPTRLPPCGITTTTRDPFPIISTTTEAPSTTTEPKSGGSDAGLYAAISILSLLFIAACLVAVQLSFMVLPCCAASTFVTAPCDADAATTIVFTEVERWKDVQRAAPEAASECIAEYRSLVRRLVVKYQCYETGSLSDAFMLVARDPSRALKFAASLQKELDGMHGPAVDAVDAAYAGLGLPSSVSVRGLRVRVGVHTDVVDIAYDVDTDHYEYRGSGCVAALRTERLAHGGQVLVTGATCEALTEKQLGEVHAVSLGSQSFPEYEESVSLFELVVLPHREMGGLCRGGTVENNDPVLSLCSDAFDGGSVDATSFALSREVLMLALSPLTPKERLIVLLGKCEERGLRVPRRGKGVTEERYADSLLNMLAQCMAAPARLCRSGAGDSAGGGSSWLTDDMKGKSAAPYVAEEPSADGSAMEQYSVMTDGDRVD